MPLQKKEIISELKVIENVLNEEDTEAKLINQFDLMARKDGLRYDIKDLINFHTAMKSSSLVILSGMSGTGKSRLVHYYARALGIADDGFKMIPVRPSWNDDADLIGYVDTMHMIYRPSETGFVNTLIEASQNTDKLYIICFDEMNLARVEHYFSQFLSILEMPGKRKLRLYDAELSGKLYNSAKYSNEIEINENVIFVGTVNMDESTFHFSDKVLDRANIIKLNILPYSQWQPLNVESKPIYSQFKWTYDKYRDIKKDGTPIPLNNREREFLWDIHSLMHSVNRNIGIGPRILKQIDVYLNNLPNNDILVRKEALDIQFVQRVITKIRGPEEQMRELFGTGKGNNDENNIFKIIEKYSDISDFKLTIDTLNQKLKELKIYGYTL